MAKLTSDEKQLLKDLVAPVKKQHKQAWLMSVFATLVFVVQSWILATIFDQWLLNQFNQVPIDADLLWRLLFWLVLCFFARPLFLYFQQMIGSRASLQVRTDLRQRLLATLSTLGMARQQFGSDGSISSQVIEQTDALDGYISRFVVQKKVVSSTPLILLIACAWHSWLVALILMCTAPFVPLFMILIGNMTAKKSAEQFSALAQLSGRFLDWVRGMTTLKRLQATHIAEEDLSDASEQYRYRTMGVLKIAFLNSAVLEFLSALCIALVAVYLGFGLLGVLPWDKNHVPVNYFGALFILLLTPEFYAPLRQLGLDYHAQASAEGAVKSLLPLLKKADEIEALNQHDDMIEVDYSNAPSIELTELAVFHKVVHEPKIEYAPKEEKKDKKSKKNKKSKLKAVDAPIQEEVIRTRLAPLSLRINSAERIGLVGESGSGKSTLVQAVMGFVGYEGDIFINEISHHNVNIRDFREHIGYLAQQVALLPISIADNLRLANSNATDEDVKQALQSVEVYDVIKQLPHGINTVLGERGQGLSGGQQQRLGVAQLLLRDSNLWLLDEPTEHLDPDTAETIHTLLEKVSQGKTVIWITHSVENLPWLDRVVEIDK